MNLSIKLRAICLVSAIFIGALPAFADEQRSKNPPPETAADEVTEFDQGFPAEVAPPPTRLEDILNRSHLKMNLRNYYFNRAKPDALDSIAWTQGGSVQYKLDRILGLVDFDSEFFGSYRLWAPDEHDGTLLLQPGQNNINVLGVLNAKVNVLGQSISGYRQRYDLPFLNVQDNRMVPNTFEGYHIAQTKESNKVFQYVAGYVDRIKTRNQDTFVSMSDAAGVPERENGQWMGGARYYPIEDLSIGAIDYYLKDVYDTFYAEANYKKKYSDCLANAISAQYGSQVTVGDDLVLDGNSYSTSMWGVQDAVSYGDLLVRFAFNQTDTGANFRNPFGSYAGYNSVIVQDFNQAGEESWQIGATYDLSHVLLDGLSVSAAYVRGTGVINEITKDKAPNEQEADVTIDYRIKDGLLKRLWIRARSATVVTDGGKGTQQDYRIIVNYPFSIYEPKDDSAT